MNGLVLAGVALWWALCILHLAPQWYYLSNYGYGWSVPFLCGYLAFERLSDAPTPVPLRGHSRAFAVGLGTAGAILLALRVIQAANPGWRPLQWTSALLAIGVTLILIHRMGGRSWVRHFWFPVAFFLTSVPWRTSFENYLIQRLSRLNAAMIVNVLAWCGVPVSQHGNVIETSHGWAGIDEACSGIRSLQATLMLGLFFGELYQLMAWRRLFLIVSGIALALLCNAGRTFTLVWLCDHDGPAVMEPWHDPTGIALLLICFVGLWRIRQALGRKEGAGAGSGERGGQCPIAAVRFPSAVLLLRPSAPYSPLPVPPSPFPLWVGPLLVGILIGVELTTEGWYRFHERGAHLAPTWTVRWPPPQDGWKEVTVPARAISLLRYQSGKAATWTKPDGGIWQMFFFVWQGSGTESQLAANHSPDVCLPASGRILERQEPARDFAVGDLQLPFQRYVFRDRGRALFAFHYRWQDIRIQGPRVLENRKLSSRLEAVRFGRRNLGQRTLELIAWGYPDLAAAETALQQQLSGLIVKSE